MTFVRSIKNSILIFLFSSISIPCLEAVSGIYDRIGIISEHGLHGAVPEENIDLFTGNLTLKNLDIHLPGPNGFDLNIWRVYNSKILKDRLMGSAWGIQQEPYSWVGFGWSMHMGRLHGINTQTPSIEYPDGRWETAYPNIIDSGVTFMTRDFAKLDKSDWKLYFKDGTIWTFGELANVNYGSMVIEQVRVVTKITNSYGHQITITYDALGSPRMNTITDSMGRTVTFIIDAALGKLKRIDIKNALGSTVSYTYTVGEFNGDYYRLDVFAPPAIDPVKYWYGNGLSSNWELEAVDTSYGGRMEYDYEDHEFYYYLKHLSTKVVSEKRIRFSSDSSLMTWTYSYPSYLNTTTGTVTVNGPVYNTSATYHAYSSSAPWKIGLLKEKSVSDGSFSEQYEWQSQKISNTRWYILDIDMEEAKATLQYKITKSIIGDADTIEEYLYGRPETSKYGLPTQINLYANGDLKNKKKLVYYFESNSTFESKYMLNYLKSEELLDSANATMKKTSMTYLTNGALDSVEKWRSGTTYLTWDYDYSSNSSNLITITVNQPGDGGIETMVYKYGVLATLTRPGYTEFTRTISSYDSSILSETNQHGGTMEFSYDNLGRITGIDMPSGFNDVTATWSDNYVTIAQGTNSIKKYWDGMGRDTGYTEHGDGIVLYYRKTLDSEGRVTAESKGSTDSAMDYDYMLNAAGQIKQITDPRGKITTITLAEDQKTVTDPNGHSTGFTYNHLPGLATNLTDPAGKTATYTYDGIGRLRDTTFNSNRTQSYTYNGLDQVTSETHPETEEITYAYSTSNNLQTKTWGGISTAYAYNTANQLLIENAGDEQITFTYDSKGRVATITGGLGWSRTAIGYNAFGNVAQETITIPGLSAKTIAYTYDGNNQLAQITYPDGKVAVYTNNGLNMPETISFAGSTMVNAITYGINKQPTSVTIGANGTAYSATYTNTGGISLAQLKKNTVSLYNADYGYDNAGNITSVSNTNPSLNVSYAYDSRNRLTGASYSPGGVGHVNSFVYDLDDYGNMTTVRENGTPIPDMNNRSYNNQNQVINFSYDSRGNLTLGGNYRQSWDNRNRLTESRTAANVLLGKYSYYDERGQRLKAERYAQPTVQVVAPNGGESFYRGDTNAISWSGTGLTGTVKLELLVNGEVVGTIAENLPNTQTSYQWPVGKLLSGWMNPGSNFKVRVSSVVPATAVTTYYFYSIDGRLLAEYDGSGNCVKDYIYMGSKLIAEFQPQATKYYYYTSNQINSTRIITDSSGTVVYSALLDPYGGLQLEGVNTYSPSLKFSGKEREAGSELDYFGARYYGHNQYRFLSVDPIINKDEALVNPQLWNLYSYCRNNPITYSDPNGTYEKDVHYNLTSYLAQQAGFSESDSKIIASANQQIDMNAKTTATKFAFGSNFNRQKRAWHFASNDRVAEALSQAFASGDLSDLGAALHSYQDSFFAHKNFRKSASHLGASINNALAFLTPMGVFFGNPDDTSWNIGMAIEMAQGTLDILNFSKGNDFTSINASFLFKVFSTRDSTARSEMLSK